MEKYRHYNDTYIFFPLFFIDNKLTRFRHGNESPHAPVKRSHVFVMSTTSRQSPLSIENRIVARIAIPNGLDENVDPFVINYLNNAVYAPNYTTRSFRSAVVANLQLQPPIRYRANWFGSDLFFFLLLTLDFFMNDKQSHHCQVI